jgi:hypothetical protein
MRCLPFVRAPNQKSPRAQLNRREISWISASIAIPHVRASEGDIVTHECVSDGFGDCVFPAHEFFSYYVQVIFSSRMVALGKKKHASRLTDAIAF